MATTITPIDVSISKLATTFQAAIKTTLAAESTPLTKAQAQKDQLTVSRAVYTDVKSNIDSLQSAVQALISSQASFSMTMVAQSSVTPGTTGSTVLSATTSSTAAAASYDISGYNDGSITNTGVQLARAESWVSATSSVASDIALGKTGTFFLGGTGGSASLSGFTTSNTSVTDASVSDVATGQRELGSGKYSVQVRESSGVRQFRLVNADGSAVSILDASGTSYSAAWQTISDGEYDTGRGLKFTLSSTGSLGSTDALTYTAKGVSISISETDTKRTIAAAINSALQPEGTNFTASIVASQLVLTGAQTGENHGITFLDSSNILGFGSGLGATRLQVAKNALFNVNGMNVSRANNTNLTDVLDGVTLNLASDAEGKTANLSVTSSSSTAVDLMNALVSKFNTAFTHLTQKLATTSKVDSTTGKTTYTRGALTGNTSFSSLRNDLQYKMSRNYTNSGSFTNLSDIGLSFDTDLKLTFDSTKFIDAITNHASDLTALLDTGLGEVNTLLSRYSGTTGVLSNTLSTVDEQSAIYDQRISKINDALTARKTSLYNTYLSYQTALADYGYQAQLVTALYGSTSTTSTSG